MKTQRLPKDDLCRAVAIPPTLVARDSGAPGMPTLVGEFAKFNEWTEINSIFEGRFLERIDPKAFARTFRNNRDGMRVLFQHGMDPQIGDKPLGPIQDLRATETGAAYEVPLLDTSYNRDLIPGLEAGLYGASFRFRVLREEVLEDPGASDHNPTGLPERTIKEAEVKEFGPVTFPAYAGATAGVRSLTDEFLFRRLQGASPDRIEELAEYWQNGQTRTTVRDVEDIEPLAQALALISSYAEDADESVDRAALESIATQLSDLISAEAAEPEDEQNSAPDAPDEPARAQQDAEGPDIRATPTRDYLTTRKERPPWML